MASPTRVNGMRMKTARCTATITRKRTHMATGIHTITDIHMATTMTTRMTILTTPNTH
jgi:hypothetical protein